MHRDLEQSLLTLKSIQAKSTRLLSHSSYQVGCANDPQHTYECSHCEKQIAALLLLETCINWFFNHVAIAPTLTLPTAETKSCTFWLDPTHPSPYSWIPLFSLHNPMIMKKLQHQSLYELPDPLSSFCLLGILHITAEGLKHHNTIIITIMLLLLMSIEWTIHTRERQQATVGIWSHFRQLQDNSYQSWLLNRQRHNYKKMFVCILFNISLLLQITGWRATSYSLLTGPLSKIDVLFLAGYLSISTTACTAKSWHMSLFHSRKKFQYWTQVHMPDT